MNRTVSTCPHRVELAFPFLMLLTLVVLATGIGLRSPWPADEPRFAQIAREMVESGKWLFPMRGGEPYPDKPPIFIWLVAAFYQVTGNLKVSFLLPSALAGFGTAWLVHDIGRRIWGGDVARNALFVLLFTPQFVMQAKTAQLDALVCFWITLGCYGFLRHFVLGPAWRWYYVAFAAMALGVMTKGVGFLPVLMLIPLAIWGVRPTGDSVGPVWSRKSWLGLFVLLGVLSLWLVPMLWSVSESGSEDLRAYRDDILFRQTAGRYANPWGHINSWHYMFTVAMPTVWLPLLVLLVTQWRRLVALLREDRVARVLATWAVLVLVFFSLSRGKRVVYILPALPMLCLVAGALWKRARDEGGTRISEVSMRACLATLGLAMVAVGLVALWSPSTLGGRLEAYSEALSSLAPAVTFIGLAIGAVLFAARRRDVLEQLALASLWSWFVVAAWVWPKLDEYRTPQALMNELEERYEPQRQVGLIQFKEQFLLFSQRTLHHFSVIAPVAEQERNAWQWMQEDRSRILLVPDSLSLECFDMSKIQLLGNAHRKGWGVIDAQAMRSQCEPPVKSRRYTWTPQKMDILGP